MHLADVMREAGGDPKAVPFIQDGRDIPVSRAYVPALKEAGLLL
jgi:hypothetical protein